MAERLAFGGDPTPEEVRDREALRHYQESLPPRLSGFVGLALFAVGVVLAQTITNGLVRYLYRDSGSDLATALGAISFTPDPAVLGRLVRAIGDADIQLLFAFVMGLLASGYILGRGPASGYRMARLALGEADGLAVPRARSELSRAVRVAALARDRTRGLSRRRPAAATRVSDRPRREVADGAGLALRRRPQPARARRSKRLLGVLPVRGPGLAAAAVARARVAVARGRGRGWRCRSRS